MNFSLNDQKVFVLIKAILFFLISNTFWDLLVEYFGSSAKVFAIGIMFLTIYLIIKFFKVFLWIVFIIFISWLILG